MPSTTANESWPSKARPAGLVGGAFCECGSTAPVSPSRPKTSPVLKQAAYRFEPHALFVHAWPWGQTTPPSPAQPPQF